MIAGELPRPVAQLAKVVSIAARIEPELLRSARLRLLPAVHAAAEADLWFSEIVASRSARRIVLSPDVASALRQSLAEDQTLLKAARDVVAKAHENAPAVVQLEEEITYLALTGGDVTEAINAKLMMVLNAIALERRTGLVEWVARTLPRMPDVARETPAATALNLVCGGGALAVLQVQLGVMNDPLLAALVVRALPRKTVHARLVPRGNELAVEISRQELLSAHTIDVPETKPIVMELTTADQAEVVEVPPEGSVIRRIRDDVTLRTIAGDVFHIVEEVLQQNAASLELSEGDIVTGHVMDLRPADILVDIGYRTDGLLPRSELAAGVNRGDSIDVMIVRLDGPSGFVLLGAKGLAAQRAWEEIERAYQAADTVTGRIVERVKGGLSVDLDGIKAFLPGSLIDTRPIKNQDTLLGQESGFKIVAFDKKRNNVVVSRRAIIEVEQATRKAETLAHLQEGHLTHGIVKNITDYGVFVDLGGVDGLLHITDISWGRVNHPTEYFNVGDKVEVMVLKFDPVAERVSLGYKQKSLDPWLDVAERYPIGAKVRGRVVSLTDYGAFLELEDGVEGLVHVSEMSWTKKIRNPSKLLSIGSEVEAVVSEVNVSSRRIALSMRALEQNPWDTIAERYPIGSVVSGRVRNMTDFGAFLEVEDGIDGLIHISDMSRNRRLKHPSEVLKKGDTVQARVISVDAENQRLSLSIREFMPNEWDNYAKVHSVGDEVVGTVAKITDFGIFIRLADGVEGLVHVSEIPREAKQKLDKIFQPGEPQRARIIKIDESEKKIGLSLQNVQPLTEEERQLFSGASSEAEPVPEAEPSEERGPKPEV